MLMNLPETLVAPEVSGDLNTWGSGPDYITGEILFEEGTR